MGGPGKIGLKHPIIDTTNRIMDIIIINVSTHQIYQLFRYY